MSDMKPMDVYSSRMDIPFDVAAFCRGRKLSPQAVELARALSAVSAADLQLSVAQESHDNAMKRFHDAVESVRVFMLADKR